MPSRAEHRAKITWIALSVPTVVVTELEGALLVGVLLTLIGWAITLLLALLVR